MSRQGTRTKQGFPRLRRAAAAIVVFPREQVLRPVRLLHCTRLEIPAHLEGTYY